LEHALLSAFGVVGFAIAITIILSRKIKLPTVLIFLIIGIIAGPSFLNLVAPSEFEEIFRFGLEILVAIIVFEGAFSIDVPYLRRVGGVVRNLLTVGFILSATLSALVVGYFEILPWRIAALFGVLVAVTGPTVIAPLVRQVRINDRVRAVLMGEAVLVDPIGAVIAIVALDIVLFGPETTILFFAPTRLLGGMLIGILGAVSVLLVLKIYRDIEPIETTLLLLGMSVTTFAISESALAHSGLAAMAVMGIVLASRKIPHSEQVRSFEDDLSKMLIGAVYVLAVATVDLEAVRDLWPYGFIVCACLMLVIRPITVFISAIKSDLSFREKTYISLIGPRGVVAAALAAFAGEVLGPEQYGDTLTALVFLTVFLTVGVQSTYAGIVAKLLGVKAMKAIIAGANPVACRVGHQLIDQGYDVTLIENNPELVLQAQKEGLETIRAEITDVKVLDAAGASNVAIGIGTTDSDEINLLFCQYLRAASPDAKVYAHATSTDVVSAFEQSRIETVDIEVALSQAMLDRIAAPLLTEALGTGDRVIIDVPIGSGLDKRKIRDLGLPESVLILLLQRQGEDLVPHGNTVLSRGDRILLFGLIDAVHDARQELMAIE